MSTKVRKKGSAQREPENLEKIDQSVLNEWVLALRHGDKTRIAKKYKVDRGDVSHAVNHGVASPRVIEAIRKFVDNKKQVA